MEEAKKIFEATMMANGFNDFEKRPNGDYNSPSLQTRWRYFFLGWQMRGIKHDL